MGGLCGIIDLEGGPVGAETIRAMAGAAAHRGPEGSQSWLGGTAALAYLALRLAPEELREQQPLVDVQAGLVLAADARIDNRDELIAQLRATRDLTADDPSDAQLILAAYRCWGQRCPERLVGDFAFAIWDPSRRQLFAARDSMGSRPWYYRLTPRRLLFASEIAQLLTCPEVPAELNKRMVAAYLTEQPAPLDRTFYEGIAQLPPGRALVVRPGNHRMWRYWDVDPGYRLRYRSDDQYAAHFREVFKEAVRSRLRSVRPVGLMLSGGMDSTSYSKAPIDPTVLRWSLELVPGKTLQGLRLA